MREDVVLLEREEPLARLRDALRSATRSRGRLVWIDGEAGIGKTCVVQTFVETLPAQTSVHIGGCEHLGTPEPLGPLRDVARTSQGRFSLSATSHFATFESLLRLLTDRSGVAVLVIEDLHWADDLTLDLLRYLSRRIQTARVLVVVTSRNDEVTAQARLAGVLADLPRDSLQRIDLKALSRVAVAELAQAHGHATRDVFETIGGNPFLVTEYLAADGGGVPSSVQASTLVRAARLTATGRRALEGASIFPRRIDEAVLRALTGDSDDLGVEEGLRAGMLEARGGDLRFRHELARRAIHEAMSPLRRRELHAAALTILKANPDASAAEIAHQAEQAGAAEDLIAFSVKAARDAAAVGAHGDSVAHLARALARTGGPTGLARAELLERQAEAGEQCGALDLATAAIDAAIAARRRADDGPGLGNALRISARVRYSQGLTDLALQHSADALQVLEAHTGSWQYAMALSGQSQLDMLAYRGETAIARGSAAMAAAEQIGRADIYMHALTNVATAIAQADLEAGVSRLQAAIAEAVLRDALDSLPRLYTCLCSVMANGRRQEGLFPLLEDGISTAVARDNGPLHAYIRGSRAIALLDLGDLKAAVAEAEAVVFGPYPKGMGRYPAVVTLSRARVRMGVPEGGLIADARALARSRTDLMRQWPIAIADAEAHWLGEPRPGAVEALRGAFEQAAVLGSEQALAETALWLTIIGEPVNFPPAVIDRVPRAFRLHVANAWREAAAAWRETGCPYEQALALSTGDEAARLEALAMFDRLGARAAAKQLRRRLRQSGVRGVPVGPRSGRRNNSAGLTPRQYEVLALIAAGYSNGEIAKRVGVSPKTVEHHVGAILATLKAPNRLRAMQIARERDLLPA